MGDRRLDRFRAVACGKGGGLLQCGAGLGSILASLVWLAITSVSVGAWLGTAGPNAWRYLYLIGVLPALVTLWIRRNIPESPRWEEANERRREAHARRQSGVVLEGVDAALTKFIVVDLFSDRAVRRPLIFAFLMMLSVTFAFWGVGTFIPTYVAGVAAKAGLAGPAWAGWAGLITACCGTVGFVSLGFLADAIGRKPTAMLWYAACLVPTPIVYLWAASWGFVQLLIMVCIFGFFTLGIWAWAPVWLPELFPTRMRGTAVAFCFNAPRYISCLGPLIAGTLIAYFGGFGRAATIVGLFFALGVVAAPFLPETNGKPLPHALWLKTPTQSA